MNRVMESTRHPVIMPAMYSGTSRTQYGYINLNIPNSYGGHNMLFVDPNQSHPYSGHWTVEGSQFELSTLGNNSTSSESYEDDDSSISPPPRFDYVPRVPRPAPGSGHCFSIASILGLNNDNMRQNASQGNRDAQIFSAFNSTAFPPAPLMMRTPYDRPTIGVKRESSEPLPDSRYTEFQYNPLITDSSFKKRKFPTDQVEVKTKRARTTFTTEQMDRLEAEFSRTQYMAGQDRVLLAHLLNLRESQVKIWFQNRRIKHRKQFLEGCKAKSDKEKDN